MKRLYSICLAALIAFAALAGPAMAQPPNPAGPGGPGGPGPSEMQAPRGPHEHDQDGPFEGLAAFLPAEVRDAARKLLVEHRKASYPIKERVQAKQHELNALLATPGTSNETINKLVEEINTLRAEEFRANVAMRKEFFKITGIPLPDKPFGGRR